MGTCVRDVCERDLYDLVVAKVLAARPVDGEDDLAPLGLGLLEELGHEISTLLVEERLANLHAEANFHEGIRHATDEHHAVGNVDEVLNDEDLVGEERERSMTCVTHGHTNMGEFDAENEV